MSPETLVVISLKVCPWVLGKKSFPRIFWEKKVFFSTKKKMKVVKIKGQPNRFFYENVKMSFETSDCYWNWRGLKITFPNGEILGRLRKLPKTRDLKRVFHRERNKEKVLYPFPKKMDDAPPAFFPSGEFVGDVLLRENYIVENVLLKFVLEGERVIPFNEWLLEIREISNRIDQALANEGILLWDQMEQLLERSR